MELSNFFEIKPSTHNFSELVKSHFKRLETELKISSSGNLSLALNELDIV